jgi:hypothetical protein
MPITGTVNGFPGGTLFIRVTITGSAVAEVSGPVITAPNQGQLTVVPAQPATLGSGTHTSTITLIACTTDINCSGPQLPGSPQVVNVTYQVGQATVPAGVAPGVGPMGTVGQVILRGSGLGGATGVTFSGVAADSFTVISNTEIHASYPATLPADTHPVQIQGSSGQIPFGASLKLVAPTAYAATSLSYPAGAAQLRGFVYDAGRQALYAALKFPDPATNLIARYAFVSGASWNVTQVTRPNLRDIALSLDGSRLLAISDTSIAQLDPDNGLITTTSALKPSSQATPDERLKSIVVANDGNAVVMGGGPNFGQFYAYRILANTFSAGQCCYFHPVAGAPANGASALIVESGFSSQTAAHRYSASSGTISQTSFMIHHLNNSPGDEENLNPAVFDRAGTRMIVAGFPLDYGVYDASFNRVGTLPATTAGYALAPDASRAYTLDLNGAVCQVRAFNLGPPLAEITTGGFPINLGAPCPATNVDIPIRLLLTPGGETLFIAANAGISVRPLP